ncbi:MAG: hypothetical protein ABFS45_27805 [Pseudomonadota bacterium]
MKILLVLTLFLPTFSAYAEDIEALDEKCWNAHTNRSFFKVGMYCKKGARLGGMKSQHVWGQQMYGKKKYDEARSLFVLSAEQGMGKSYAALGEMHEKGYGVIKDACKAKEYYLKGVELNDITSNRLLGNNLLFGSCSEPSPKQAIQYLENAAMTDPEYQYLVGTAYSQLDDFVNGHAWMSVAKGNGFEDEKRIIDAINQLLSEEQKQESAKMQRVINRKLMEYNNTRNQSSR